MNAQLVDIVINQSFSVKTIFRGSGDVFKWKLLFKALRRSVNVENCTWFSLKAKASVIHVMMKLWLVSWYLSQEGLNLIDCTLGPCYDQQDFFSKNWFLDPQEMSQCWKVHLIVSESMSFQWSIMCNWNYCLSPAIIWVKKGFLKLNALLD